MVKSDKLLNQLLQLQKKIKKECLIRFLKKIKTRIIQDNLKIINICNNFNNISLVIVHRKEGKIFLNIKVKHNYTLINAKMQSIKFLYNQALLHFIQASKTFNKDNGYNHHLNMSINNLFKIICTHLFIQMIKKYMNKESTYKLSSYFHQVNLLTKYSKEE